MFNFFIKWAFEMRKGVKWHAPTERHFNGVNIGMH
jgi:hypothetical protein